jgi:hypothetical protein
VVPRAERAELIGAALEEPQWMSGIAIEARRMPGRCATFITCSRLWSCLMSSIISGVA